MSDTNIQNVADIDQPAELEGIWLNWGPSEFVETRKGPRDLRTAPRDPGVLGGLEAEQGGSQNRRHLLLPPPARWLVGGMVDRCFG